MSHFQIIFLVYVCCWVVQMWYYLRFYRLIFSDLPHKKSSPDQPVSVVICAHNEADNLQQNLPAVLQQNYSVFEVVVVNDSSTDDTAAVLAAFQQQYKQLRVVTLQHNKKAVRGKKAALTAGIRATRYASLLLTDADCRPATPQWIRSMTTPQAAAILGYGAYRRKKGVLNRLIRFETLFVAMQYMTFALARRPYMGVGRNLAYRRELFEEAGGFSRHRHLASGDDDLFINQIAEKHPVAVQWAPESFTVSGPETRWQQWWRQKRRHFTAGPHYRFRDKMLLSGEMGSRTGFYLLLPLVLASGHTMLAISVFVLRFVVQQVIFGRMYKRFRENDLLISGILLDFFLPLAYLSIFIANQFVSFKHQWK